MIPKIIHFVWLGDAPLPEEMRKCIESWKKWMPDYQLMTWDNYAVRDMDSIFIREALEEKKWAFASDVVRLYAIYQYGGIYLDTDVMVYRSFDSLLENKAFIGRENSMHQIAQTMEVYLTTCCFGAEKGNPFIKRCLDYYNNRHFVTSSDRSLPAALRMDMTLNSFLFTVFAKEIGFNSSVLADHIQICQNDVLTIFPQRYFDATSISDETFCKHLALGSWRDRKSPEPTYNLRYKIEWRLAALLERFLRHYHYVLRKID